METDAAASPAASNRPRPLLLILLGLVVIAYLFVQFGGSSGPNRQPSNAGRAPQPRGTADAKVDPAALDVQLEALEGERPGPGGAERNPFRFQAKAPPASAAPPPSAFKPESAPEAGPPPGPPSPPPPPPITVKFIGTVDLADGTTMAIFTDCTVGRKNIVVREGQTILGQYRLVKIGLESVVVEHIDGRGRTTLPKGGQECVK